jgi:hypothetical protein
MNCFNVECPAEACYINPLCPTDYQNRIVALAFVKKSVTLDKTTAALWLNSILLAYVNGDAVLVLKVSGEKPIPETATLPGFGRTVERLGAKTHTITVSDRNGVVNVESYNAFLQTSDLYDTYYLTPNLIWDASGQQVTINGDIQITNEITTYITGQLIVKWAQTGSPLACEFNDIALNTGLYYVITNAYDLNFTIDVTVGVETNSTFTAALNQPVTGDLPDVVWSVSGDEGDIEDFGISIDSVTGVLTVDASNSGTTTVTVTATNDAGCVTGSQNVVIIATEA